ncbi:MAG: PHP domain-containing protein [Clostridia bacterium]|nr:PHP domain-containing protein [Clostridia bacterium]
MKKYLLPQNGNFYKANLHCHTNCSDGKLSPEEVKNLYKENGYSIIAFTDHDVLLSHTDLNDENFLALNGYEIEVNEEGDKPWPKKKTCHMCLIALKPDNLKQVCYHREWYLFGNAPKFRDQLQFDENLPDFVRHYTPECINEIMKTAKENGFFVTYNHPTWSLEDYSNYINYTEMNAMEIINGSCLAAGYNEYNERVYSDFLNTGKRLFCIATDDNHNFHPFNSRNNDSCIGFTVIKAPSLNYCDITNALVNGDFYASEGPEIKELWYEDGKINITCSNADSIVLSTGIRRMEIKYAENGEFLTQATFNVQDLDNYVKITVTDERGKHAYTNAYFVEDLLK